MRLPKDSKNKCLLATMTNEPFQPVRLYYSIPDRSFVTGKLRALKCMIEVPPERCWQWLFHAEAASLRFPAGGYDDVPKERRPIVLGRIRFPKNDGIWHSRKATLSTLSLSKLTTLAALRSQSHRKRITGTHATTSQ
jgi:hypothetical protein